MKLLKDNIVIIILSFATINYILIDSNMNLEMPFFLEVIIYTMILIVFPLVGYFSDKINLVNIAATYFIYFGISSLIIARYDEPYGTFDTFMLELFTLKVNTIDVIYLLKCLSMLMLLFKTFFNYKYVILKVVSIIAIIAINFYYREEIVIIELLQFIMYGALFICGYVIYKTNFKLSFVISLLLLIVSLILEIYFESTFIISSVFLFLMLDRSIKKVNWFDIIYMWYIVKIVSLLVVYFLSEYILKYNYFISFTVSTVIIVFFVKVVDQLKKEFW